MDTELVSEILRRSSEPVHCHLVQSIEQISKHSIKANFSLQSTHKGIFQSQSIVKICTYLNLGAQNIIHLILPNTNVTLSEKDRYSHHKLSIILILAKEITLRDEFIQSGRDNFPLQTANIRQNRTVHRRR